MPPLFLYILSILSLFLYIFARKRVSYLRIYIPDGFIAALVMHWVGSVWLNFTFDTYHSYFIFFLSTIAVSSSALTGSFILASKRRNAKLTWTNDIPSVYLVNIRHYKSILKIIIIINIAIIFSILSNSTIRSYIIDAFLHPNINLMVARKAIATSSEGYIAPGFIKIFRDIISPIAIVSFIIACGRKKIPLIFWISVGVVSFSILIGGQRFPFVLLFVMIIFAHANRKRFQHVKFGLSYWKTAIVGAIIVASFAWMSQLLGHQSNENGILNTAMETVVSIFERVFLTVPSEALRTYPLWSSLGPTWGLSWWADLMILVPGPNTSFSNELHAYAGGSFEGNSVLFFAVDSWFAFGIAGTVFASIAFVSVFHALDSILWRVRSPVNDASRYLMFIMSMIAYSPYLFLLNGGIVVLLVAAGSIFRRSRKTGRTGYTRHLIRKRSSHIASFDARHRT